MECNKDEAIRAKEIAERKFDAKDFVGAKKFALKAQNLYPLLDGISQMSATFDVYACASTKTNGEADLYTMLGVAPSADVEAIRKQYRKLALTLHPDKNKSAGAEGAFHFISEAWSLLSDKSKRASYDQRRSSHVSHHKSTPASQERTTATTVYDFGKSSDESKRSSYDQQRSSNMSHHKSMPASQERTATATIYDFSKSTAPARANSFTDFSKPTAPSGRANNEASWRNTAPPGGYFNFSKSAASSGSINNKASWASTAPLGGYFDFSKSVASGGSVDNKASRGNTALPGVMGFNEFSKSTTLRFRVGNNTTSASNSSTSGTGQKANPDTFWTVCCHCNMQYEYLRVYLHHLLLCPECKQSFLATEKPTPISNSNEASFQQQRYQKAKGECEKASAANRQDGDIKRKYNASENASSEYFNFANKRRSIEEAGLGSMSQRSLGAGFSTATASIRHGSSETFQMNRAKNVHGIRELAQNQIHDILIEKARAMIHKKINEEKSSTASKDSTLRDKAAEKAHISAADAIPCNDISAADDEPDEAASESLSISVPDCDFYDFDKDRTEKSFEENQVWAAYDTDDGMPRFYAIIKSVLSRDPFKVRISWFNPKSNTELGPMDWVGSGFSKTCGDFRVSRYEVNDSLNSFSHTVKWTKGARGVIHIFPRKGDVWALYRNWSPDWNNLTPADIIHKYDMVEVLEDYDKEAGVVVTPLVKVAGFKMVYRHLDLNQIQRIPREEMFRLSHQVPRHLLTDEEAPDILKGCMELDPAAAPVEIQEIDC